MSSPKKNVVLDPDYEISNVDKERVRLKEEKDSKEKNDKLNEIINREFQTELDHRQSQLDLIQQRLNQAQKTLHLLRYVLITSYYNENQKLINQTEEPSNEEGTERLHPAVKKLLGSNIKDPTFNIVKMPRKRLKQETDVKTDEFPANTTNNSTNFNNIPCTSSSGSSNCSIASAIDQDLTNHETKEFDTGRNRKKTKYRIVVGNISKWMPSHSEKDKSTHKWMVYVRGPKDNPDISHFVQKVVFYLHPSYQPHDVIELSEGPFHLSRRGWGEFPLRIRIFFQCPLNKPVDIIHNLMLDKTFTGRQTLGNETVVNLHLYYTKQLMTDKMDVDIIKKEPEEIVDEYESFEVDQGVAEIVEKVSHYEHDYCLTNVKNEVKQEVDNFYEVPSTSGTQNNFGHLSEHSYFRNSSSVVFESPIEENLQENEATTDLIYGIQDMEENRNIIVETVLENLKISKENVPNSVQTSVSSNGTVIAIKKRRKPQQSLLKRIFQKKYDTQIVQANNLLVLEENCPKSELIDYERHRIKIPPDHNFKNVPQALPFLFKRLPLISESVMDINYKCTYPYVAQSLEEYTGWNIGKQLSAEWFRAKTILNILTTSQLPDLEKWTTKGVIMYGRAHGFTPLCSYGIFRTKSYPTSENFLNGNTVKRAYSKAKIEPDILIDVENCLEDKPIERNATKKLRLLDTKSEMASSFIKQTLLDAGIILKAEDIIPDVLFNGAERVILQAVLSLAEDLIRRGRSNLVRRGNFQDETSVIEVEDIKAALQERPEFHVLLRRNITDQM